MGDDFKDKKAQEELFDEIKEFLRQLSWPFEALSPRSIKTYYHGDFDTKEVIIHLGNEEVCLVIDPVLDCPKHSWGTSVVSLILAMGEEIKHVGIGLDGDGDLFVKVHLPAEHVNLERFQCLLQGLCQVAENIILPVLQANAFDNLEEEP